MSVPKAQEPVVHGDDYYDIPKRIWYMGMACAWFSGFGTGGLAVTIVAYATM